MATALNQSLCGCTEPWRIHQQIVTYYTDVPERGLFVVTWWEHNAAPATGSNTPAITVGGLGEAHAWAVVQVRAGQAPPRHPSFVRRLRDRVWRRGDGTAVDGQGL